MFGDLTKATESLDNLFMEDEGGAQEVTVDLEIQVTEDAVAPVEEAVEADEVVEETTDTVEEMLGTIERMEHNLAVVEEFGYSRALAMVIDPTNELSKFVSGMPAVESLDITGSPSSAETVMAVEGFKEAMKSFWEWIKKMARKIWEAVTGFFRSVINLFTSYEKQAQRLAKAMKEAKFDGADFSRSAKLVSKSDWTNGVTTFKKVTSELTKFAGGLRAIQIIEKSNTPGGVPDLSDADFAGLGISGSDEKGITLEKKFSGKEMKVSESGWTPGDFTSGSALSDIISYQKSKLPSVCKEIEAAAKRIESQAVAAAKDDEKKDKKEAAKKAIKYLNQLTKLTKLCSKIGSALCKAYIRAGYAVYNCKGTKKAD